MQNTMIEQTKKRGQPPKKPEDRKVPLTFHVKARNKAIIHAKYKPIIEKLDSKLNTKEEDYV